MNSQSDSHEPEIKAPILTSANVTLCWIAESNKTYRLEYAPDLGLTNWNVVSGGIITSSNKACVVDALTSSNRFYHIQILP